MATNKKTKMTYSLLLAGLAASLVTAPASAQDKPQHKITAVATTSILGDLVHNVGGDRIDVTTLVGPDGDPHVYSPTPGDARTLAAATIIFANGLGLEGWMTRLVTASGSQSADRCRRARESHRAKPRTRASRGI